MTNEEMLQTLYEALRDFVALANFDADSVPKTPEEWDAMVQRGEAALRCVEARQRLILSSFAHDSGRLKALQLVMGIATIDWPRRKTTTGKIVPDLRTAKLREGHRKVKRIARYLEQTITL